MKKTKKWLVLSLLILLLTIPVVWAFANAYDPQSASQSTYDKATITSALRSSNAKNDFSEAVFSTNVSTSHTSDALNSYVITDNATANKYLLIHNNNSATGRYLDLFINKIISYDAGVEQYVVYDFDITRLGNFDSNFNIASITRSADNKTAYWATNFPVSSYQSRFPLATSVHVTVVYDFNNNASYMYVNNAYAGNKTPGVMSEVGFTAWKGGAAVNHNSIRLMNPLMNLALDNVTVRYVTNDASLKSALGSSLASWNDAIYNSSYTFNTVHPIATVDAERIYFEEDLAAVLALPSDDKTPVEVEILRPFDTAIRVERNAKIETHNLKFTVTVGETATKTTSGSVITVKTDNDMSNVTTVTLPSIYQSGMVFQRGEPITVRGYCKSEGAEIKVTLGNTTLTGMTDKNGEWEVTFDPMSATKGLTLTVDQLGVTDGKSPIIYTDIDVGDVFLLSGQSNMDYNVRYMEDYEELKANAYNYHNLRGYLSDNTYRHGEDGTGKGKWYTLTSENIDTFPAYGYVMATKLSASIDEDVTIAIVEASFPGSIIKTWIDADVYYAKYGNDTNYSNYQNYLAFYEQNGRCPTSANELSGWVGKSYQQILASCYDSIIAPLEGYRVKAVVWDQGSGDLSRISEYAAHYALLQESFNSTLRTENVPFIMHNLVPRGYWQYKNFLVEQYNIAANDPYTYLVSVGLDGAVFNSKEWSQNPDLSYVFVHTSRKSPLGIRTANVILDALYGIDADTTPMVSSVEAKDSSVVITVTEELTIAYGRTPVLFEIAGADGVYHEATATINGNKITLAASSVTDPKKVRYAYSDLVVEMQDGTIVEIKNQFSNCTMTESALTITASDGTVYTITKDAYDSIRSYCTGNVTSTAGSPLPAFELAVGYTAE